MRLICPNCDAQYEVDAALIPATGRDVQCSNCGKTWFQEALPVVRLTPQDEVAAGAEPAVQGRSGDGLGREAEAFFSSGAGSEVGDYDEEDEVAEIEAEDVELYDESDDLQAVTEAGPDDGADEDAAAGAEPGEEIAAEADGALDEDEGEVEADLDGDTLAAEDEDDEAPVPPPPDRERPEVDAAVLGILKAEAEREIAARRADAEAMESQPDLGLAEPDRGARQAIEARTARLRGAEEEDDIRTAQVESPARRALLPDVEEINSTLTATSDRATSHAVDETLPSEATEKRRSGFRMGFSLMMLATAAAILVYLFAPQLSRAVPALAPPLAAYVDWANVLRQNADGYLERTVNSLTDFLVKLSS